MSGLEHLIRGHPRIDVLRCLSFELVRTSRLPIFEVATCFVGSAPRLRTRILDIASSHLTNPAFEITILKARNLGVTFCPLKSICSNPMRRKLLNYFLREPHRHTLENGHASVGHYSFMVLEYLGNLPPIICLPPFRYHHVITP